MEVKGGIMITGFIKKNTDTEFWFLYPKVRQGKIVYIVEEGSDFQKELMVLDGKKVMLTDTNKFVPMEN